MSIVYIKERYYYSLVCKSKKALKKFEVKVDVQKGALQFRVKLDNRCVIVSSSSRFHPLLSYDNSPQ